MSPAELHPRERAQLRELARACQRAVGDVVVDFRVLPGSIVRGRGDLNLGIEVSLRTEDERAEATIRDMFEEALVEGDLFAHLTFSVEGVGSGESLLSDETNSESPPEDWINDED